MNAQAAPDAWNPSAQAIEVKAVPGDAANPGSVLVTHFRDPFEQVLQDTGASALQAVATDYLRALEQHNVLQQLDLPDHWLPALTGEEAAAEFFGWMPMEPDDPAARGEIGPDASFRIASSEEGAAVLFASERWNGAFIGSGFGVSVVVHVSSEENRQVASITGMMATLPFGPYKEHAVALASLRSDRERSKFLGLFTFGSLFRDSHALQAVSAATGLEDVVVRGVRIALDDDARAWVERRGVGLRHAGGGAEYGLQIPYAFSMLTTYDGQQVHELLHTSPLVANGARVFDLDPSTLQGRLIRPTRNEQPDPPVQPTGLDPSRFARGANAGKLEHHVGGAVVTVMPCPRFVPADAGAVPPRSVTLPTPQAPDIRSDDASAVQALFHTRELLERLQAYGWHNPAQYFKFTKPELRIFYRSSVSPGPGKDGRTVNACVIPEGWKPGDVAAPPQSSQPQPIQIHLGWADLRRRERKAWTAGGPRVPAIPMGVAADKRWMWHEFGHVLLVASTGELEFWFAHSAGDAMAAIVTDPHSALPPALRGSTFPFVHLPRQHDRCSASGWSWSGTQHAALAAVPASQQPRRKGYASEQILSSSLFRLYRCIGGDTLDLPEERLRASHYTLYLVMQAMHLMGSNQMVDTPEKFVARLKDADTVHAQWSANFGGSQYKRMGRTLHKVIRWAFEAQGLYGSGNGPGSPEPVDIYIRNLRPTLDQNFGPVEYGAGSYVPVSLHWQAEKIAAQGPDPLWQAHRHDGIFERAAQNEVDVLVRNRGTQPATNVAVRLWAAEWPDKQPPPAWNGGGAAPWAACQAVSNATQNVQPGGAPATFTFKFAKAAGKRYVLFAQASCVGDKAITVTTPTLAGSLVDIAANDNNLALLVVT